MQAQRIQIQISGLVQGVGFRHYAARQAQILGLCGYVENNPQGGVRCCVEGDEVAVNGFVQWCHGGPPLAVVESVRCTPEPYRQEFHRFEIR